MCVSLCIHIQISNKDGGRTKGWTNVDQAVITAFVVDSGGDVKGVAAYERRLKKAKTEKARVKIKAQWAALTKSNNNSSSSSSSSSSGRVDDDPTDDILPQWGGWQFALESASGATLNFKKALNEKGGWQDQAQAAGDGDNG